MIETRETPAIDSACSGKREYMQIEKIEVLKEKTVIELSLENTRLKIYVFSNNKIELFSPSNLKVGDIRASNALDIFVDRREFAD